MSRVIHKFPLGEPGEVKIIGMEHPKLLDAGLDPKGQRSLWAEVTPEAGMISYSTFITGTGGEVPIDGGWTYFKSWIEGPFVWHLYYKESC